VGGLNIDGCRVETADGELKSGTYKRKHDDSVFDGKTSGLTSAFEYDGSKGRFPANVIHDGSDEVVAAFPDTDPAVAGKRNAPKDAGTFGAYSGLDADRLGHADNGGSAARFFYTAKADAEDRIGAKHPTVKPVDLMQYVVRLITPPGGLTLDPFAGTGTTGEAAFREGMRAIIVERETTYQDDIRRRMEMAFSGRKARARKKHELKPQPPSGGMFED
jgi:hypothetical protein